MDSPLRHPLSQHVHQQTQRLPGSEPHLNGCEVVEICGIMVQTKGVSEMLFEKINQNKILGNF